jgi:DNA-binding LacI/PurR family transcriptional regulator
MTDDGDTAASAPTGARGKVTLREIAESAGVSISTASRALSGSSGLSDAVRQKVQAAADRLSYLGVSGSRLAVTVLTTIDVGATGSPDFQLELFSGIEGECRDLGVDLSYSMTSRGQPLQPAAGNDPGGRHGYTLLSFHDEALVEQLRRHELPAVIVNGSDPLMRLDAVSAGNRAGGFAATRHLLELGHSRILTLTHRQRQPVRDRLTGSDDALAAAGLAPDPTLVIDLPAMRADSAYAAVLRRVKDSNNKPDFTAIQCCNDASAFGAMTAVTEAGFRVPEEISIIGFDDIPMAAMTTPSLTTIRVPRREIGAAGLRRLLARMRTPDLIVTCTEFAGPLVVRGSTGPAKS